MAYPEIGKEVVGQTLYYQTRRYSRNDDTGTMSAWAIFSMMGLYPDCPGVPEYTLTTPTFDEVTIKLDPEYWVKINWLSKRRPWRLHQGNQIRK